MMNRARSVAIICGLACALMPESDWLPRPGPARVSRPAGSRRGRPRKFGGPARPVTLTLPEATIAALKSVDADLGRAIVRVAAPLSMAPARPRVELVTFGSRAIILVSPSPAFTTRTGAELVPTPDGRAIIALGAGLSASQFELRLLDALADPQLSADDRQAFADLVEIFRRTRRDGRGEMLQPNIIVLDGVGQSPTPQPVVRA